MTESLISTFYQKMKAFRSKEQWESIVLLAQEISAKNALPVACAAEYSFSLAKLDKYDPAEKVALQVLQHDQTNIMAMRTLVLVRLGQQQLQDALPIAQRIFQPPFAFSDAEEAAQAILTLASVHKALNQYPKALELTKESIRVCPLAAAYALLGMLEFLLNNFHKSEKAFAQSLSMRSNTQVWRMLIHIYQKTDRIEDVVRTYEAALNNHPEEISFLSNLGEWYTRLHRYPEAEVVLHKVIALKPDYLNGWVNFGKLMFTVQKSDECAEAIFKAVQLAPGNPELLHNLAVIFEKQGKCEDAMRSIEKAYAIAPEKEQIAFFYALACEKNGASATADKVMQTVLEKNPVSSEVLATSAQIAFMREQHDSGLAWMHKALACEHAYLLQRPSLSLFGDGTPPPMDVYDASETLIAVCSFLEKLGVSYFLASGTLLGIIRDGDLLPHDKDADLGIAWDVDREWLMQQFEESDELDMNGGKRPNPEVAEWNFSVSRKGTPIGVDFFFYKPDGDDWLTGLHAMPTPWLQRFKQRPRTTVNYKGHALSIPENPEGYLEEVYGPNWRTPIPCYDTLIAAENLCPESFLTAKIIGYKRLYGALTNRSWKKVLWYCEALKRFDNPPILDELADWLRGAMPSA